MNIVDKIPAFDDESLATLRKNAARLTIEGNGPRRTEAESILPLIDAEVAKRLERLQKANGAARSRVGRSWTRTGRSCVEPNGRMYLAAGQDC